MIFQYSIVDSFRIDTAKIAGFVKDGSLSMDRFSSLKLKQGKTFKNKLDFENSLFENDTVWIATGKKLDDKETELLKSKIGEAFRIQSKIK